MQSILNLTNTTKLILAAFAFLAVFTFGSGRANAATLNVTGGCTLPIAINSVNAGANQSGCTAVVSPDSYGTNDTITIPAGTITLTASLPAITEDVTIQGAGIGDTIVDGDSDAVAFEAQDVTIAISDLTVTAYRESAVSTEDCDVTLENIEVDGTGATDAFYSIIIVNSTSSSKTITSNNIYLHDINDDHDIMYGFSVHQSGGGTTTADLSNITLADSSNSGGSFDGFVLGIGAVPTFGAVGNINGTISNATLSNLSASEISAPYATFAFASGGTANVTVDVYNSTITGNRGSTGAIFPIAGIKSAAFYSAAAGLGSSDVATSTLRVGNSLFADNLTDTNSSNCESANFTSSFGGTGTGIATTASLGHNISDDATCTSFTEEGDQQNVNNIISTLGPLQNNGGAVPTRALLPGSPAIASGGSVLGVTTDARGIARPSDCPSVGAFQFEGAVCAASTTNAGTNAGAPNTGANPVSLVSSLLASFTGLLTLGYVFAHKRA